MAKLTHDQKNKLYADWLTGEFSLFQLANRYGISQATVSNLIGQKLKKK